MGRFKGSRRLMLGALFAMTAIGVAATNVPGKIEAESYASMAGVQLEACSEGTQNVGWIETGDWMAYAITVPTSGSYTLQYRVASPNSNAVISSDCNAGATQLGTVAVPNTGGWQKWTTVTQTVTLPAGTYNLRVFAKVGGFNLNWITVVSNTSSSGPAGYTKCAGENGTYTFGQTVDVAYGANGSFKYKTGVSGTITFNNATFGDPIVGVVKAGYYKVSTKVGPAGYTWCADENASYTFNQTVDVAYGASGAFAYRSGVSGTIAFNNATFGDPISGVMKAGYYKASTQFALSYAAAPADNPLKGFMPYQGSYTFPHSLEWFYLPLKDLQTGTSTFNWDPLEAHLAAIAGRGHQAVFRVYLDYPDVAYGVPSFLSAVPKHAYTDYGNGTDATSFSPDYSNADLQRAVLNFITALGARYDNDPRIAFITAGLLGFWGEWHTYPYDTWAPTPTFMNQVLDAYQSAFPHTPILAREPKDSVNMDRPRLGFHDDSFAYTTVGSTAWYFWPKIAAANLQDCWKNRPIGGEVRPEVQSCLWNDTPCTPSDQGFDLCVGTTHASWMLNHGAFTNAWGTTQLARATAGAQSLGYTLHVPRATLESPLAGKALQGTVTMENRGVAPFYYPWTVQMAVLDKAGNLSSWPLDWDLRTVLPGSPLTRTFQGPNSGLPAGDYTLLLGVPNPMAGGHPLKFANTTQDQHRVGWLTLGSFSVKP